MRRKIINRMKNKILGLSIIDKALIDWIRLRYLQLHYGVSSTMDSAPRHGNGSGSIPDLPHYEGVLLVCRPQK